MIFTYNPLLNEWHLPTILKLSNVSLTPHFLILNTETFHIINQNNKISCVVGQHGVLM